LRHCGAGAAGDEHGSNQRARSPSSGVDGSGMCAANSFILHTHQVNALLMSFDGYRNADYFKADGGMTVISWWW